MKRVIISAAFAAFAAFGAPVKPAVPGTNPVAPFVAITGRPTDLDVSRKVEALHRAGFERFLVYARSGLEYKYMGEEWLHMVETFCREAYRLGMKVWLYDEYNWPSGTCRGRVPRENDDWRYVEQAVLRNADGSFRWEKVYAPAGWVNACDYDAVKRFIELTHDVYHERLKTYLENKTIAGIFTDEPGHPVGMEFPKGTLKHFRWFRGLEEEYKEFCGGDFRKDVEAWVARRAETEGDISGEDVSKVWVRYAKLVGRRFRKAYFDQIRAKCDEMGILLTGHLISEDSVNGSCEANGDPMEVLKGESLPGLDELLSRTYNAEWLTQSLAQHAVRRNGRGGLAEMFGLGPNDMPPARLRQMFWLEAYFNVDNYLVAMDAMDMKGLVEKHGYLAPFGQGQSWFFEMGEVFADAKRAAAFGRRTKFDHEVAVRYPQTLAALATYAGGKTPQIREALRVFNTRQISLDFCAEEEETGCRYVFSMLPDGESLKEERSGATFSGARAAADWLEGRLRPRLVLRELDGSVARNVLVRNYSDGASLILNLHDGAERILRACGGDWTSEFALPSHGVLALEAGERPPPVRPANSLLLDKARFEVETHCGNVWRVNFGPDKVGKFFVGEKLAGVKFALRECALSYAVTASGRPVSTFEDAPKNEKILRHDAVPYSFELDGKPLKPAGACRSLPAGFRELYRDTEPMDLEPGEHTLRIVTGEADQNYFLPAVFVAGDFGTYGRMLSTRKKKMPACSLAEAGLGTYAGAVTYSAEVELPRSAREGLWLRIDSGRLLAKVKFAGRELGVRSWEPFEWEIPEDLRKAGKGRLEVTVYPPLVNMMGETDAPGAKWDTHFWVNPRSPDYRGGLYSAKWVW